MEDVQFLYLSTEIKKNIEICKKATEKQFRCGFDNLRDFIYYSTKLEDYEFFLRLLQYSKEKRF